MPFFLVTQTSLVEGKDELSAAEKTLRQIREADEVAFSVKFDEETITQVSISVPGKMLEETASTGLISRGLPNRLTTGWSHRTRLLPRD